MATNSPGRRQHILRCWDNPFNGFENTGPSLRQMMHSRKKEELMGPLWASRTHSMCLQGTWDPQVPFGPIFWVLTLLIHKSSKYFCGIFHRIRQVLFFVYSSICSFGQLSAPFLPQFYKKRKT